MNRFTRQLFFIPLLLVSCVTFGAPLAENSRFTQARAYADGMLEHGRDTYGPTPSPAFAATIDIRTMTMPLESSAATTRLHADFFRSDGGCHPNYAGCCPG